MLEYRFINGIFNNPEILEKTILSSEMFDDLATRQTFAKMKYDYMKNNNLSFINTDYFINLYDKKADDWFEGDYEKYNELFFNSIKEKDSFDWQYVEQLLLKEYKNRKIINSLTKAIEKIESSEDISNVITNLESEIKNVGEDRATEVINAPNFTEMYDAITEEIKKSNENGKPSHYTLKLFEAISNTLRIKKGWLWTLVSSTGGGKTIIMALLTVLFAKTYKERCLFITDENSIEVILTYMHCGYFGLKYYDIEDRKIDLSSYINKLSDKEKKEYDEIFSLIDVIEMPCVPMIEVKKIIKTAKNNEHPYTWVVIDSFEEINMDSSENIPEVDRYDRNAKDCERLAKDMDIILGVTSQLKTDFYTISIEKMPILCNHQSKTLIKKCYMALLFHNEYNSEGKGKEKEVTSLGFRCRVLKCRSGGVDSIFEVKKNFDYCQIVPSKECLNVNVDSTEEF